MIGGWLCRHGHHAWRQRLTYRDPAHGPSGWWQCKRCGLVAR